MRASFGGWTSCAARAQGTVRAVVPRARRVSFNLRVTAGSSRDAWWHTGCSRAGMVEALARRVLFALPVVVLLALGVRREPAPGLREEEVLCEEAEQHIRNCCGPRYYGSNLSCVYVDRGCDPPIRPDLTEDESDIVRRMSCEEITAQAADGYCPRQYDHSVPSE